ncbi:hypothetical protein [Isoptericola cucumis]|uniref:Lumazine-binding protein n=1 Tax=Isoptericola cucumis TaxID=1776856 RepID=A0ABQ2B985_9MICO|nr:hypothetical protein [Isoptericola cucumis]GGI11027.1 hypothetical protein GCM10007368_34160 [Isoptericola cucumis]
MNTHEKLDPQKFFDAYAAAMLERDAKSIADLYAVPALVEFPGQAVAVSDASQTEQFFAASFGQYEDISDVTAAVETIADTSHSSWVKVCWSYDGTSAEQFIYQLVQTAAGWRIAVLTPLVDDESPEVSPSGSIDLDI